MLSRRMPFRSVPCRIWLPAYDGQDAYGNRRPQYAEEPDVLTECCYAPGRSRPDTADDIEEDRPHGDAMRVTFYLPKTLDADLREARIACDGLLGGRQFDVVGQPVSYMRENTPGDYSWSVEGVLHLG